MSPRYQRLAARIGDAVLAVAGARSVRDEDRIEDFGDLDLILAELKGLLQRCETTEKRNEP